MNPVKGGPCQGIRNIIPVLEKRSIQNEVLCLDDPTASFLGKDTFPIHAIGSGKGQWSYNAKLIPWLLHNFDRFDVVIVHGLWQYHSYAVRKAMKQYSKRQLQAKPNAKIPILYVMPHGMLDPYFQKAPGRELKALRNWAYWKLIEGPVINDADGVLFTCETEMYLAREPFRPYHPKKEINIGYGIARPPQYKDVFRKAFLDKCPGLEDSSYFIFLSRIHEKKGVDLLIKAYAAWVDKKLATGAAPSSADQKELLPKLVIAGPGMETPYGQQLLSLVGSNPHLQQQVFFPGMLSGDAKWGALYGSEAFVLPSHQENFGIAVVEALACGKPVLISNQVNIWREIEATGGGMVADDTLAGTQTLLEKWEALTLEEKKFMEQQALLSFEQLFDVNATVDHFLEAVVAS